MRPSRTLLLALSLCVTLGLALGGPTAVADPPSAPGTKASPTGQDHRADRAADALADVQALLSGLLSQRGPAGPTADARSLTVALRDLAMLKDALPAEQRARAESFLARPDDADGDPYLDANLPREACGAVICVHYTEAGASPHRARGSDGDPATVPSYITTVLDTLEHVHRTYVAAGYRRPKPDGGLGGGTDMVDVYIGDIGSRGLYGYCTTDDPNRPDDTGDYSFWAYCTLDNDYARTEFPSNTPLQNMRVTAAHEYFHAVQYAYDAWEDGWILESTATWAEDELYDAIDDNRQYLRNSPLSRPQVPLDRFGGGFHYGTWIWWRHLTEKYPPRTGALPNLVLKVWRQLDGTPAGPDRYSTQGLAHVLQQRDTTMRRELALFAAANRHPAGAYDEGGARAYRPAAPAEAVRVSPAAANPAPVALRRDHLSSATVRFTPRETDQRDWRLRLDLDLPPTARGAAAVVLVYRQGGGVRTSLVHLGTTGDGRTTVPFSTATVRRVEAVLVNASTRFRCWQGTSWSCQGRPRDNDQRFEVDARAFRA